MPVGFFITSFIGVVVTSSAQYMYGEAIWDPLQLLEKIDSRPAVFFIALAFALATLATNLCANSIPAGADMSALLPRYLNIRRGGYVCAIIGICITPWKLLSGASNFLNFLSAYAVFLGPICGVMVADCKLFVDMSPIALYNCKALTNVKQFRFLGQAKTLNSSRPLQSRRHLLVHLGYQLAWLCRIYRWHCT